MIKPDWDVFKVKFKGNSQDNLEWFAYLLFCREYKKPQGIFRYKNQSGIETNPISVGSQVIGWQAKFFESTLSDHKDELIGAIMKSNRDYPGITKVIFYTNQQWGQGRKKGSDPEGKTKVEQLARSLWIKIEWRGASFFESPFVAIENAYIAKQFFQNHQTFTDNSWYEISKLDIALLEILSKFIVEKMGERWGLLSAIASMTLWLVTFFKSLSNYFLWLKAHTLTNEPWTFSLWNIFGKLLNNLMDKYFLLAMLWLLLAVLWFLIFRSIEYRKESQCPKCKRNYALKEIGEPKEKEIKTSQGYKVTRVRFFKCNACSFEKEEKTNFDRNEGA